MRKSLRIMMHALAVFMLLVAVATPVFWVRSRTRSEVVWVRCNSVLCSIGSWNSRVGLSLRGPFPGRLNWDGESNPMIPDAASAWSYTVIRRDPRDPDHVFNFSGVVVERYTGQIAQSVTIPYSYLLLFCLSVPAWWFWRVRRGCQKCQSGFQVEPLGLKDKG